MATTSIHHLILHNKGRVVENTALELDYMEI